MTVGRGLDHVAHAVRDLDAAAELYRRMGFAVGARNRHGWGTHNAIVQLPGFFVELLTLGEPDKLGADALSEFFGRPTQDFLAKHEGLAFLVLESKDATADAKSFQDAHVGISPAVRFDREGKRPDGTAVKVAFSLAFARDALAPGTGFFVCQQHYPENFWNPKFQIHENGVCGIDGVVLVAESPTDHQIFLSAFSGERELQSTSNGIAVTTPRGTIQVMEKRAFRDHFAVEPPDVGAGARLAALRFATRNLDGAAAALERGRIPFVRHMGRAIVAPDVAMGAAIVFEPQS
jgi:catechol 2,3-dioxygenase-like lactoylglutathione lyase family enzyme